MYLRLTMLPLFRFITQTLHDGRVVDNGLSRSLFQHNHQGGYTGRAASWGTHGMQFASTRVLFWHSSYDRHLIVLPHPILLIYTHSFEYSPAFLYTLLCKEQVRWGADIDRYCDELQTFCLHREFHVVAAAVRAGLETQLPAGLLSLLRWEELEELVCGRAEVDVALLQSATEYERGCGANDMHIQWLWELLKNDFSSEDKKVWPQHPCDLISVSSANCRLTRRHSSASPGVAAASHSAAPASHRHSRYCVYILVACAVNIDCVGRVSDRILTVFAIFSNDINAVLRIWQIQGFPKAAAAPDNYLPVSHTCFFSIELPR